jgi:hypothetical protein
LVVLFYSVVGAIGSGSPLFVLVGLAGGGLAVWAITNLLDLFVGGPGKRAGGGGGLGVYLIAQVVVPETRRGSRT